MISTIVYIICLITIAALYFVSYKSAKKNFKADLDRMEDACEREKNLLRLCIDNLKAQRSELKVEIERRDDIILKLENRLLDIPTWRLSSDELPETNDRMLVCSTTTKGEKRINIAWYSDGKWHGNGNLDNVTAWMPLPQLPEGNDPSDQCKMQPEAEPLGTSSGRSAKCKVEGGD